MTENMLFEWIASNINKDHIYNALYNKSISSGRLISWEELAEAVQGTLVTILRDKFFAENIGLESSSNSDWKAVPKAGIRAIPTPPNPVPGWEAENTRLREALRNVGGGSV